MRQAVSVHHLNVNDTGVYPVDTELGISVENIRCERAISYFCQTMTDMCALIKPLRVVVNARSMAGWHEPSVTSVCVWVSCPLHAHVSMASLTCVAPGRHACSAPQSSRPTDCFVSQRFHVDCLTTQYI